MAISEGNTRLNVVVSNFDLLQLKIWAKAHGKTPSAYAAQILAARIEANLDLVDNLASRQAEAQGMTKEDWLNQIAGSPDDE